MDEASNLWPVISFHHPTDPVPSWNCDSMPWNAHLVSFRILLFYKIKRDRSAPGARLPSQTTGDPSHFWITESGEAHHHNASRQRNSHFARYKDAPNQNN